MKGEMIEDLHSRLVDKLFARVLALVDQLSKAESDAEAIEIFSLDSDLHWNQIGQTLAEFEETSLPGVDLGEAVRIIATIYKGTRTQCVTFPDVAVYIFKRLEPLRSAANRGWLAAKHGGTIPEDPFPVMPHSIGSSTQRAEPIASLREVQTESLVAVKFIEAVRGEVYYAAEAKRQQLERGYSNVTLANMVRGIKWREAREQLAKLTGLGADALEQVTKVLRRELTVGTVDQVHDLLTPAVRTLRDAWEDSHCAETAKPPEPSSAEKAVKNLGKQTATAKRRGRRKADFETVQKEAQLAADWKRAKGAGRYKLEFAKDHSMTLKQFDALLDRVAKRNRHSE